MATSSSNRLLPTTFTDQAGRSWSIRFTGNSMREIKDDLGINICEGMSDDGSFFKTITSEMAMGMTWIAIRRQADAQNIKAEEFLDEIYGQALLDLNDAFWSALLNFTQGDKALAAAGRLIAKTRVMTDRKMAELEKKFDEISEEEIETMFRKNLTERSKQSSSTTTSGSAPESSESTPAS